MAVRRSTNNGNYPLKKYFKGYAKHNKGLMKKLSINANVSEIFEGKNRRGNKKLELIALIKLFTESEISYFNNSMLKPPRSKIILDDSFCNFYSKGAIKLFVK